MMKKPILACAIIAAASPAWAQTEKGPGAWEIFRETHEIDGTSSYSAMLASEKPIFTALNQRDFAHVIVTCSQHGMRINVAWPDIIGLSGMGNTDVRWRLDDGKVVNDYWSATAEVAGPDARDSKPWIHKLAAGHRLIVQIDDQHGAQEAAFNLEGMSTVEANMLTMPCAR